MGFAHARIKTQGFASLGNSLVYLPVVIKIFRRHAVSLSLSLPFHFWSELLLGKSKL